jgi:hypothetical protein
MKKVTKYQANDESVWNSREACCRRDRLIDAVDLAMSKLKPIPSECNWEGYVQQDSDALLSCKKSLFDIANTDRILSKWINTQMDIHRKSKQELVENTHPSWFQRMLDGGHDPLSRAYSRLCCIDDNCKEWNQPYFANNEGTGVDVCVG